MCPACCQTGGSLLHCLSTLTSAMSHTHESCGHSGCSAAFVTRHSPCPVRNILSCLQARLRPSENITSCAWLIANAVYLCCTVPGVASAGRYPASCPVKPGLSSPAVFRHLQPRSSVLLRLTHTTTLYPVFASIFSAHISYTPKQPPPINSLSMEFGPILSPGTGSV